MRDIFFFIPSVKIANIACGDSYISWDYDLVCTSLLHYSNYTINYSTLTPTTGDKIFRR